VSAFWIACFASLAVAAARSWAARRVASIASLKDSSGVSGPPVPRVDSPIYARVPRYVRSFCAPNEGERPLSRQPLSGPFFSLRIVTRRYRFVWLDVFSKTPLEGNQLAVFPDARGLSDDEMQAIARETHLSETTFVFPEDEKLDRERGFRTRIFAVFGEMPFAGHPTLGTAAVLSERTGLSEVALRLQVGRIPVRFTEREGGRFGEMTQAEPVVGTTHDPKSVASALGTSVHELDLTAPIQTISTGVPFAIVPFRSLESVSGLRPSWKSMEEYLRTTDAKFFYLLCRETVDPSAAVHARMVFSGGDDPATGSAAGPAVAWMVLHGWHDPGRTVQLEQGTEVHRSSHLYCTADLHEGRPTNVRVGGFSVPAIEGELEL